MALKALNCVRFLRPHTSNAFLEGYHPILVGVISKYYATRARHGSHGSHGSNGSHVTPVTHATSVNKSSKSKSEAYQAFLDEAAQWDTSLKPQKTNRAMKMYVQRAKEHDDFMKQQQTAYQIGKRHLANMMGEDPTTFTQENVDEAIKYLFPSGIFDPKARPFLKPPEVIFPPKKAAEFDEFGRPFHSLFYTARPNYHQLLYDLTTHLNDLKKQHNDQLIKKIPIDPKNKFDLSGRIWVTKDEFEGIIIETVLEREFKSFIIAINRLVEMPNSAKIKQFIEPFLKELIGQKKALEIPLPQCDENGRAYITTYECLRKAARGQVTIRSPGTGLITINGKDITYFKDTQSREQLLFPLQFAEMINSVDVECQVEGGGPSGQSGALRWGIAIGLRSFVDMEMVKKMRLAGLLTRDYRRRERKKPGQKGARAKFTWKKR